MVPHGQAAGENRGLSNGEALLRLGGGFGLVGVTRGEAVGKGEVEKGEDGEAVGKWYEEGISATRGSSERPRIKERAL